MNEIKKKKTDIVIRRSIYNYIYCLFSTANIIRIIKTNYNG